MSLLRQPFEGSIRLDSTCRRSGCQHRPDRRSMGEAPCAWSGGGPGTPFRVTVVEHPIQHRKTARNAFPCPCRPTLLCCS